MLCCQGVVQTIVAMPCAKAAHLLGGGRNRAGEAIDLRVGLYFTVAPGHTVKEGKSRFRHQQFQMLLLVT